METKLRNGILPFAIVTFIYFIVGFLTTINEQLQAPLKFAFLAEAGSFKNTFTTLISFFFFLGYLLNGTLASKWVNAIGYKNTIIRGLMFMISGLLMYLCSSWFGDQYPHLALNFGQVTLPYGFVIFVLGSYLMGTSAAVIQVVVNPYVASYELPGTQPVQRLNITTAINSVGTTSAPFFVTVVMFSGISLAQIQIKQLMLPLMALIGCVVLVTLITSKLHLPDIANTRAVAGEKLERSIWSFRHFTLGVLAIFFYVGTEVSIGANINLHAFELMDSGHPITFFGKTDIIIAGVDLGIHALLSTLYWGGFLVGRAISCIFSLSIKGLNKYTSKASGLFISAVFGGAVFTLVQGGLADVFGSWRWTWGLTVICELLMLSYALFGSRIRAKDVIN